MLKSNKRKHINLVCVCQCKDQSSYALCILKIVLKGYNNMSEIINQRVCLNSRDFQNQEIKYANVNSGTNTL